MLCQFTFKNFKSYKAETVFDLQATSVPEFNECLIKNDKGSSLLPVSVIYGPNGGGKTNLLQALSCLLSIVVKPIHDLEKNREKNIVQHRVACIPFMFDDSSKDEPIEFEIFFRKLGKEYRYYISLLHEEILSEGLQWRNLGGKRTGTIFERNGLDIVIGSSLSKARINKSVNPKMPYLSFLAINYNIPAITEVQQWFESCIVRNYGNPIVESSIMLDRENVVPIVAALNDLGIDLTDYRIDNDKKRLYTRRLINGKIYELPYEEESEGTKKLICVLPYILLALKEGRLIVVDELDAKLHPKLLRYVISLFKNNQVNKNNAQLLFTSHDISTMKNSVFRRDEIWYAVANSEHESEIYSLYEIRNEDGERIKNTTAYDKQYLEGRYGADPYLTNMLLGGEWK